MKTFVATFTAKRVGENMVQEARAGKMEFLAYDLEEASTRAGALVQIALFAAGIPMLDSEIKVHSVRQKRWWKIWV